MNRRARRMLAIVRKESTEMVRDWPTLLLMLSIPIIELFLFAYVGDMVVEDIPTVVADLSHDAQSRALIDALEVSGSFLVQQNVDSEREVIEAIDQGQAGAGVVIPPGFGVQMERGQAQALILLDGSDSFMVQSGYSAANAIAQAHAIDLVVKKAERKGMPDLADPPIDTTVRILYNPNADELMFLIPGIAAALLQVLAINATVNAVVRERTLGTIEQLLITPIRPVELMLGKMASSVLVTSFELAMVIGLGIGWFKVPFRGSVATFVWLSLMFIVSGLGLGLVISTVARNQKQAQQMTAVLLMLTMLLSGLVYPRTTMFAVVCGAGNLIPATYFIRISRAIITKGVGLDFIWEDVLILAFYATATVLIASKTFKMRLD